MPSDPNKFGQLVRIFRVTRNLSLEDVAQRAGVHFTTLGRIERGTSQADADVRRKLVEVLGMPSEYIDG